MGVPPGSLAAWRDGSCAGARVARAPTEKATNATVLNFMMIPPLDGSRRAATMRGVRRRSTKRRRRGVVVTAGVSREPR